MGWMMIRLVLSLLFVAAVLVCATRVARKRGLGSARVIEVLSRQPLTRASSVTVVKVADRVFLVGTTEAQVSLLAELDQDAVTEAIDAADAEVPSRAGKSRAPSTGMLAGSVLDRSQWGAVMDGLREKTVRR